MELLDAVQVGLVDLAAFGQFVGAAIGSFAVEQLANTIESICLNDTQLIVQI